MKGYTLSILSVDIRYVRYVSDEWCPLWQYSPQLRCAYRDKHMGQGRWLILLTMKVGGKKKKRVLMKLASLSFLYFVVPDEGKHWPHLARPSLQPTWEITILQIFKILISVPALQLAGAWLWSTHIIVYVSVYLSYFLLRVIKRINIKNPFEFWKWVKNTSILRRWPPLTYSVLFPVVVTYPLVLVIFSLHWAIHKSDFCFPSSSIAQCLRVRVLGLESPEFIS